jgi:hypothetical protein
VNVPPTSVLSLYMGTSTLMNEFMGKTYQRDMAARNMNTISRSDTRLSL